MATRLKQAPDTPSASRENVPARGPQNQYTVDMTEVKVSGDVILPISVKINVIASKGF